MSPEHTDQTDSTEITELTDITVSQATRAGASLLAAAGVASADVEARLLMRYALASADSAPLSPVSASALFMAADDPAPDTFEPWLQRRVRREPLQHIVGSAPFDGLDFFSAPGAFIPRPETELLVEWAAEQAFELVRYQRASALRASLFSDSVTIVDICSGPGTIALAVAHRLAPLVDEGIRVGVVGLEKSPKAIDLANKNAAALPIDPRVDVRFLPFDVAHPLRAGKKALVGTADVVVSNPPYVPADADVSPEVHADPPEAVFSGDDGLELMPKVVELAALLSAPHSAVGIEHDDSNGEGVQKLMHEAGMIDVQQHDDLAGRPRFVSAHVQRDPAYIPPQV